MRTPKSGVRASTVTGRGSGRGSARNTGAITTAGRTAQDPWHGWQAHRYLCIIRELPPAPAYTARSPRSDRQLDSRVAAASAWCKACPTTSRAEALPTGSPHWCQVRSAGAYVEMPPVRCGAGAPVTYISRLATRRQEIYRADART